MKYGKIINTKLGKILIVEEKNEIIQIQINDESTNDIVIKNTEILNKTAKQLEEYLSGKRKKFDIPLNPQGTNFSKKVWKALLTIPYGQVRTYKQIAEQIENPKAFRAVGMANHNNPIPILIPCHRVIGTNGSLTGYAGGIEIKKKLLDFEKSLINSSILKKS